MLLSKISSLSSFAMKDTPLHMHGIQMLGYGGDEMLQYREDLPTPIPTATQVLIKVSATGVNNTDINTRLGWYAKSEDLSKDAAWSDQALQFPRIQGADVCGYIVAVGEQVNPDRIGERVLINPCLRFYDGEALSQPMYFGSECDGGFAAYTVVESVNACSIKSGYSDFELASFPCSYSTAENMLTRTKVTSKKTVVITGASGGVGSAALQLAKARGAYVICTNHGSKSSKPQAIGADEIVLRANDLQLTLGKNKVDDVIDLVAGPQFPSLLEVIKPFGRYAIAGAIAGAHLNLDVRTLYLKDLSFFGCTIIEEEVFPNLIRLIETKKIQPLVAYNFPLKDIIQAQKTFLAKDFIGKIVLTP